MTKTTATAPDPYDPQPTFWQRHAALGWPVAVFGLTVFLTYAAFPPFDTGEAAYVLAVPAVLWAYRRPSFRIFAWTVVGAQVVAWTMLLGWLHNVTWVGMCIVGIFAGGLTGLWSLAAWWAVPRVVGHQAMVRIFVFLGLAGLWVVLEWVRSTLFGGFPWLPLAASQWQRPLVLQSASYGGAWLVSFVLIYFNLGTAAYANRIFYEGAKGLRKRSPEFMVALTLLVCSSFPLVTEIMSQQRQPLAKVALVQPYIPQDEKWDAARASDVLRTIEQLTVSARASGGPDVIVWPEAVTPWVLNRDPAVSDWLWSVAKRTGRPLLLGTVSTGKSDQADELWYNGAFVVAPATGVVAPGYAKRKLVPFGEYIPWRPIFGWVQKVAPIGGDFERGRTADPLLLPVRGRPVRAGVLICYEDIFPGLARDNVLAGAEVLTVLTNNGWFGEGGAAYQHATHSVLRAIETRRPVIRCGNGGWSGWIDEFGQIRANLVDARGSVYFRGAETVAVTRDARWHDRLSFYTRHGDWFLLTSFTLAVLAYYLVVTLRPPRVTVGETVF